MRALFYAVLLLAAYPSAARTIDYAAFDAETFVSEAARLKIAPISPVPDFSARPLVTLFIEPLVYHETLALGNYCPVRVTNDVAAMLRKLFSDARGSTEASRGDPATIVRLSAARSYLNARYREFNDGRRAPTFSCNPTGNAVTCAPAFAPPITFTLASDYTVPLGDAGSLTFGGDGRFVDGHFLSVDNRSNLREPGYWVANAYVKFDASGGAWFLRGGVKNLSDARYRTDGQEFSSLGNIQTVYFGDPRTFNATVGFRF